MPLVLSGGGDAVQGLAARGFVCAILSALFDRKARQQQVHALLALCWSWAGHEICRVHEKTILRSSQRHQYYSYDYYYYYYYCYYYYYYYYY